MKQFAKWASMFGESTTSIPNSEMLVSGLRSIAEDVDPESIDVSSFEVHDEINKDFWNQPEDRLDPEIREKLLAIAQDFYDSLEVGENITHLVAFSIL